MKINEVIQEGVWDNLKTAGQTIKQGAGAVGQGIKQGAGAIGQGVKQGAGAVANYAKQNYQQTMQARQQRSAQQAAAQKLQPMRALGTEWSPQAQLKAKNAGTFAKDLAGAVAKGGGESYFTKATDTITQVPIPVGSKLQTTKGVYTMTAQGWHDPRNTLVTDAESIDNLNNLFHGIDSKTDKSQQQTQSNSQTPPESAGESPGPNFIWNGSLWVPK
jgi:hypothetical protein